MPRGEQSINDADQAYEVILDAIVTQALQPSQKVSENILSQQFGISRTIARNLIERLVTKQFLVSVSQRVTKVAPLTLMEIKQNFLLRKLLLPDVIAMVAPRVDYAEVNLLDDELQSLLPSKDDQTSLRLLKLNRQINMTLCQPIGYPLVIEWMHQLEDMAMRIYWLYIKTVHSFPYSSEHQRQTFDLIRGGDAHSIRRSIRDMLTQTEDRILNAVFSHEQFYTQDLLV